MAVLLVATFPILLLINGPLAVLGLSVGILLLYRDYRDHTRTRPARSGRSLRPSQRPRARQRMAA